MVLAFGLEPVADALPLLYTPTAALLLISACNASLCFLGSRRSPSIKAERFFYMLLHEI